MKYEITANGSLRITLENQEDRDEAQSMLDRATDTDSDSGFLADLLEDWTANGHLYPVAPEWIGALTSAPIITDDLTYSDDGTPTVNGRIWWFPDYQVKSFAENLIRDGSVSFDAAPQDGEKATSTAALETRFLEAADALRSKEASLQNQAGELDEFIKARDELIAHPGFAGKLPETFYSGGHLDPFAEQDNGPAPSNN